MRFALVGLCLLALRWPSAAQEPEIFAIRYGSEILPGISVFTGGRHTYASQYVLVGGSTPVVLASDNAYLYLNINEGRAGATFAPENRQGNLDAVRRMIDLVGDPARVIPGHDPEVFLRFHRVADGVVRIQPNGPG